MAKTNVKVRNFLDKHRSYITLAAHTDRMLFSELERLFQEMYDLGHADGWAEAWSEMNRIEEENGNL
jgi:hypothetical protein